MREEECEREESTRDGAVGAMRAALCLRVSMIETQPEGNQQEIPEIVVGPPEPLLATVPMRRQRAEPHRARQEGDHMVTCRAGRAGLDPSLCFTIAQQSVGDHL